MKSVDRKLRVFLCHSSQDKPVVRELYQRLNAEAWIDPWLDEEELLPGQDWGMEIEKAVETTDAVIVCLSNNSVTKEGYIQKELRFVLDVADEKPEGTMFVIPLRLDDCKLPRRLKIWQYLDYFPEKRRDWANKRLSASLELRAAKLGVAIKYPDGFRDEKEKKIIEAELEELSKRKDWSKENEILYLAQASYRDGKLRIALKYYAELIKLGALLQIVIYDLELASKQYSKEIIVWQTLGDAYKFAQRESDALDAHNIAQELADISTGAPRRS